MPDLISSARLDRSIDEKYNKVLGDVMMNATAKMNDGRDPGAEAPVFIRAATPADVEEIARIHLKVADTRLTDLGPAIVRMFFANCLARNIGWLWVGGRGDRISGFIFAVERVDTLFRRALLASFSDKVRFFRKMRKRNLPAFIGTVFHWGHEKLDLDVAEMVYMSVDPDSRGGGIGRLLWLKQEDYYRSFGAKEFYMTILADNPTIGFFLNHGMREFKMIKLHGKDNWRLIQSVSPPAAS
jgi:GNAT superfamily N-acetyltransferase